jgi:OOP family OmpA-OmpF porin
MKYFLTLLAFSFFVYASEIKTKTADEFALIKPVAVEEAPVVKVVQEAPLDSDSDGILDKDDKCPNTQAGEKIDEFGCMIKLDADKDGIPDEDDRCPNTSVGAAVNDNGCELDSDEDGIVDSKDKCADTSKDFVVDGYGCPQTATLKVNFAPNKYNVSDELINDLQNFAKFLNDNVGYQIIIYGYTDSSGNATANKKLSQNRANAVKEALSRYGIKITRMTAIGKGDADPIANNDSKEGRAKNRRIEVELLQ